MIRFDIIDPAQVAFLIKTVQQPGTAFDILSGLRINPGGVEFVGRTQVKGFNPVQQIVTTQLSPALHVGIADAAVVGIDQVETALAATAAFEGSLHSLYSVTELLNAKVKSKKTIFNRDEGDKGDEKPKTKIFLGELFKGKTLEKCPKQESKLLGLTYPLYPFPHCR